MNINDVTFDLGDDWMQCKNNDHKHFFYLSDQFIGGAVIIFIYRKRLSGIDNNNNDMENRKGSFHRK